jgi:FkbM family methyltransferase
VARRTPGARRPWFRFEPFEVPFFGRADQAEGAAQIPAPDGGTFSFVDEPHHQYYLRRVLHGREYPALHPDVYLPTTILDIGAHVGSAARYFAQRYPAARIVSIEPTPESFALLERNTRHLPNVERFNVAFAAQAGSLRIWRGKLTSGQNSAVPNEENGGDSFEATAVVPLQFCDEHALRDISIIKIDVEGLELQILRNLAPLLARVDVFYVEYHSEQLRRGIEDLLGPAYSLFAAEASEADRGTACYARSALIEQLRRETSQARYVFAKAGV